MRKIMLGLMLFTLLHAASQEIDVLWSGNRTGIIHKIKSKEFFSLCSPKETYIVYPLTFTFDFRKKVKIIPVLPLENAKIIGLNHFKIDTQYTPVSFHIRHIIKKQNFTCILEKLEGKLPGLPLKMSVCIYYVNINPKDRASGNCFKCSGKGTLGSWCTFCHGFMASCIHGQKLRNCNACSGIGWIELHYQRCPHCYGKGWVGTWCNFCHGHMVWCYHTRWRDCGTCRGKGALTPEYSKCSKCNGRGWVATWCNFCHGNMIWCRHGISPRTCSGCGGKGVVK